MIRPSDSDDLKYDRLEEPFESIPGPSFVTSCTQRMPAAAQLVPKDPVDGTDSAAAETGPVLRVAQAVPCIILQTKSVYLAVPGESSLQRLCFSIPFSLQDRFAESAWALTRQGMCCFLPRSPPLLTFVWPTIREWTWHFGGWNSLARTATPHRSSGGKRIHAMAWSSLLLLI